MEWKEDGLGIDGHDEHASPSSGSSGRRLCSHYAAKVVLAAVAAVVAAVVVAAVVVVGYFVHPLMGGAAGRVDHFSPATQADYRLHSKRMRCLTRNASAYTHTHTHTHM